MVGRGGLWRPLSPLQPRLCHRFLDRVWVGRLGCGLSSCPPHVCSERRTQPLRAQAPHPRGRAPATSTGAVGRPQNATGAQNWTAGPAPAASKPRLLGTHPLPPSVRPAAPPRAHPAWAGEDSCTGSHRVRTPVFPPSWGAAAPLIPAAPAPTAASLFSPGSRRGQSPFVLSSRCSGNAVALSKRTFQLELKAKWEQKSKQVNPTANTSLTSKLRFLVPGKRGGPRGAGVHPPGGRGGGHEALPGAPGQLLCRT